MNKIGRITLAGVLLVMFSLEVNAQEERKQPRFSHKGFKFLAGLGALELPSGDEFDEGQAAQLSLGYGFSNHSTLWLTLKGAELPSKTNSQFDTNFNAVELSYQYKFMPQSRLQPYGKIGIGAYELDATKIDVARRGGGINVALGADFFLSRHFGIGVEAFFKDIEYTRLVQGRAGGEIERDITPSLNRDSRGLMLTLTIQ
ncbi:MAG: outer membrane beta-barrel protein [Calditrichaeota bacterium]|nr:outer membrane beta-barrel protein [Calditrichota bacterium]